MVARKTQGFTLIELMIVVAIIGVLAAVAIPKFADMMRRSREGSTKGGLNNLRSALTIYMAQNEGSTPYLGTTGSLAATDVLVPKYIDSIPIAKLGTYHGDSSEMLTIGPVPDRGLTAMLYDTNGWIYSSSSGGLFFVNCIHTDTKNNWITNW